MRAIAISALSRRACWERRLLLMKVAMLRKLLILAVLLGGCEGTYEPIPPEGTGNGGSQGGGGSGEQSGGGGGVAADAGPGGSSTDGSSSSSAADDPMVRTLFSANVRPVMTAATCSSCHDTLVPIFGQTYDTMLAYANGKVFNCALPAQSLLVTKGVHEGPALNTQQKAVVNDWLVDFAAMSSKCNP